MRKIITIVAVLICSVHQIKGSASTPYLDSLYGVYNTQPDDTTKLLTLNALINATMYRDPNQSMTFAREMLRISKLWDRQKWESLSNYQLGVLQNNQSEYDSARYFYRNAFVLASGINDAMRVMLANNGLAVMELNLGNFHVADSVNDFNIELLIIKDDQYRLSIAYMLKANIHHAMGNYNIAYQNAIKALQFLENFNKPVRLADAVYHLALIEQKLGNVISAIDFNHRALSIYREHRDLMFQAQVLSNLGELYILQKSYNEALIYLEESVLKADSADNKSIKASSLVRLGELFMYQQNPTKAIEYILNAIDIFQEIGEKAGVVKAFNTLGKVYNQTGNPGKAIEYLNQSVLLSSELELRPELKNAFLERSTSYELVGQPNEALKDFKSYQALSDSLFAAEKLQQIEELRIMYDTEQKEKEIELQKIEIELFKEKGKYNQISIILLITLLLSVIITGLLSYQALRQKLKRKKIEHESIQNLLSLKKRELTTHILHIAHKNDLLMELKQMLLELKQECPNSNLQKQIINKINIDFNNDNSWDRFNSYFEDLHKGFEDKIREIAPDVSKSELRLISLLKMNLNSQEVASVLNISQEGIKKARYRLRKKLGLETGGSLEEFLTQIAG
jgi:tetratricopeptide (TPR) repeat protein